MSGFIARHMLQPDSRHSAPASRKTASSPSASAWWRTRSDPGTIRARTLAATFRPPRTFAAARRASIRPLVHEPMKTTSTAISVTGVPGVRPM